MEDLSGKQLGKYQVIAPLGEGGMAAVYKAFQPGMDRYVALKILPRHFARDPEFLGRFDQEARVIANLQHPHILPVHDYGESDTYTYLVMPLVETGTLADLMTGEPVDLQRIRRVITQVGDALDYAHSQQLIHRDVKPSNVLIDTRGNCLLTDFGIAKMVEGTSHFTQTGAVIGTPRYMSPEQGSGEKLTLASDIYSLGVVMYEMATGRAPFDAETPMAIVIKHMHSPLPPPRDLNPALPHSVERVILKAMAKEPGDRFKSAADMVRMVRAAIPELAQIELEPETVRPGETEAFGEPLAPVQPEPGETVHEEAHPAPKPRRRGVYLGLGAAGIVGAILCAAAFFGGRAVLDAFSEGTATAEAQSTAIAAAAASGTASALAQEAATATAEKERAQAEEATALAEIVQDATATAEAEASLIATSTAEAELTVSRGPVALAEARSEDLPSDLWEASLVDTFDGATSGWSEFRDFGDDFGSRSFTLEDGVLRWEVTPLQDVNLHDSPAMDLISDFLVSVEVKQTAGPATADFGISFRVAADNQFYTFNISDTGRFAVQRLLRGEWTTLINWTDTTTIQPGETNRLSVLGEGNRFTFFINDQFVGQALDEQIPRGRVGLVIDAFEEDVTTIWEFDNFELRQPWPTTISEAFDSDTGFWDTGTPTLSDLRQSALTVSGGGFQWDLRCSNDAFGCLASSYLHRIESTKDFYVSVDARVLEETVDTQYGLRFRDSDLNYFDFMVSDHRNFTVGLWFESESTWHHWEVPAPPVQPDEVNRLAVYGEGSHFIFYINSIRVGEVIDDHLPAGAFALSVSLQDAGEARIEFDNFEVRVP